MDLKKLIKQYGGQHKVAHLLQIDTYFGSSKKSIKKQLIAAILLSVPVFIIFGLWRFIAQYVGGIRAIVIVMLIYAFYAWQVVAHVLLNQTNRVKDYLRAQKKKYESVGNNVTFKKIENSIIYFPTEAMIAIECYSGSQATQVKALRIKEFLDYLYDIDNIKISIVVQNCSEEELEFKSIYSTIRNIEDKDTAKQILDLIRDTAEETISETRILRTVYCIYCNPDEAIFIKQQLENALPEEAYYKCTIADDDRLNAILEYDLGVDLDRQEIIISSYQSGYMGESKILFKGKRVEKTSKESNHQERRL